MKTRLIRMSRTCLVFFVSMALITGPAAAGPMPGNLSDILYQDEAWGKGELRKRGYTLISSNLHDGTLWEYWWNDRSNTCLKVHDVRGKYDSINTTSSTDCNQYHSEATKNDNTAAIILGAAALLGVATLAAKSHQRDDQHSQDSKTVAEFDRGYRDGLHHERYHNYQNTKAYSDGYSAGQRERDNQTSHRSGSGHHSGYQHYVSLSDLTGVRASSADSELYSRGFRNTGGYKQDNKSFATWWNPNSRQCVQVVTKEGRIKRINNLNEGNCI